MARSRRHAPIIGTTHTASEKRDKRHADRNCRSALRRALKRDLEGVLPIPCDVSDPWCMAMDGHRWVGRHFPELLRRWEASFVLVTSYVPQAQPVR